MIAKFKTLQQGLFLSVEELADWLKVHPRSVRYWLSGERRIPDGVMAEMEHLNELAEGMADRLVEQFEAMTEAHGDPGRVCLVRYHAEDWARWNPDEAAIMPNRVHQAALFRAFLRMGQTVDFVDFDPEAYDDWLDGRADNRALRAEWASDQIARARM